MYKVAERERKDLRQTMRLNVWYFHTVLEYLLDTDSLEAEILQKQKLM